MSWGNEIAGLGGMTRACEHVMGIKGPYGKGSCVSGCVMGESRDPRAEVGRAVYQSSWKRLAS